MSPPQTPTSLPREWADLLIDLSIALHKHAMYPEGHPSLAPAAEAVIRRLDRVMGDRATLSIGVARNQLLVEGMATDPKNAVLKELAGRLHRHHLGAISFRRGLTSDELQQVLETVSQEADRRGPLGLGPTDRLTAWPHVRLYPLSYDRMRLADDDPDAAVQDDRRSHAAQLWLGLAQAALAVGQPSGEAQPVEPGAVAEAVRKRSRDSAYDQVIVDYLLQIAAEIKRGGGEAITLQKRLSELIGHLDSKTLDRLLEMGGDRAQRHRFLLDASDTLAVETVVDLARAAGRAEQKVISRALLRMLQKLGRHASAGAGRRRVLADQSVREQVAALIHGWALEDPSPTEYRVALERMAGLAPPPGGDKAAGATEPARMLQMAMELNVSGPAVHRAVVDLVEAGQLSAVAEILQGGGSAAEAVWQQLAGTDVIQAVASADPIDAEQLDLLLPRVGLAAAEPMLDALGASESRKTRRVLLDRLVQLGSAVGPLAVRRLKDASWFVQRNMLAILSELPAYPHEFDPQPFLEHPDARVRREALRLLLRSAATATRERAIHIALADPDQRAIRLGLATAVAHGLPESAVPLAASLAVGAPARDLRISAIRALGTASGAVALEALLGVVTPKKRAFWRRRMTRTPEVDAAAAALTRFADLPQVRRALARLEDS